MAEKRKDSWKEKQEEADGIIEGRNAVTEALRAGVNIDKIFLARGETDATLGHIASTAREKGIVVVESDLTGGSMHTVEHVTDQSRDLYAVPGPADAITSLGPNTLIQEGSAKLVMSGWDVLEEYEDRYPAAIFRSKPLSAEAEESRLEHPKSEEKPEKPTTKKTEIAQAEENRIPWSELRDKLTDDQRDILLALEERPCIADELVELTQIPARRVLSSLTILQVGGYVAQEAGKRFRALVKLKME